MIIHSPVGKLIKLTNIMKFYIAVVVWYHIAVNKQETKHWLIVWFIHLPSDTRVSACGIVEKVNLT